jgi:di/tricarboxylate transporter
MAIALVLGLLGLTLLVLSREWMSPEVYGLLLMVTLVASRVLTPKQAFAGFAGSTVTMLAGVMLLTGAIVHNGAADLIARRIRNLAGTSEGRMATLLIGAVNAVSSVVSNVATTAIFIPVAEVMASRFGTSRSKYLMPVAFASMTGGMCTLIGTSTNVAVSGAVAEAGLQPLGLFELTPLGVTAAIVGGAYLLLIAPRLLSTPTGAAGERGFAVREFLYEIIVKPEAAIAGQTIADSRLREQFGLDVLAIVRGALRIDEPTAEETIQPGDLLLAKSEAGRISEVRATRGLEVKAMPPRDMDSLGGKLAEITVSYNSPLIGRTIKDINFRQTYGVSVLALQHGEGVRVEKVGKIPLRAGDVMLAYGSPGKFSRLAEEPTTMLVETLVLPSHSPHKAVLSSLILVGAMAATASGWLDLSTAMLGGAALVMALGCLPIEEAGAHLNLRFLVLIAALSALALAMETSGAAALIADRTLLLLAGGGQNPYFVLAALFTMTVLLTQPLNNAAAALLVLPVALHTAETMHLEPRSFIIGVTAAASCSFITPFEPACLLVYATGHYRFRDFVKVGAGMTAVIGLICLALIPLLWPFTAK